ncbi:MAG: chromosome segregation protein SMC [Planctomycetia bacterium]|nr:chromosome segregation protein SMC [Planctomycetia bacterium]
MLKALEIIGFKSFAEKTRFEFPPGITVVVGPNGSGKSNIVDSLKWVLGEQSVKSLRGKEMADVIFNGSPSRRATNSAEITVTFDNANHLLPIDTPEVHITRRIYRSGEGEYLINRQPSRLRDIRELLSGTGMGTQAYSVIEQGKVDVLLQSSAKDRRLIFEEAAGISLFKAKKLEALRRLDRVEQNLLRLQDIVDEVDGRLRAVRAQAGKARRYKEYADRLQELRTQVALVDWHRLSERLEAVQSDLADLNGQRDCCAAEVEAIEARLLDAETRVNEINEAIRAAEGRIAANRERIAGHEATLDHERRRGRDLEQEVARHRDRLAQMSARAGDLQQQLVETADAVETAESHRREVARRLVEGERVLTDLIARLDQIRAEHKQREAAYLEQMAAVARLSNEISALGSRASAALASRDQHRLRLGEFDSQLESLGRELAALRDQASELSARTQERQDQFSAARGRLDESKRQLTAAGDVLARCREQHGGIAQRIAVLDDLERRHEGLSAGVKEVLAQGRKATDGPFAQVVGLVADLLRVSVESAPLVEIALGAAAQHVVLTPGNEMLAFLQKQPHRFSGRVGFLWLEQTAGPITPLPNLEGKPGVLGRADRFVETEPRYAALARRLLGRTWIVENLERAIELSATTGTGVRLLTLAGDLLETDGTLSVGPAHVAGGLISRRSELRELRSQLAQRESDAEAAKSKVAALREQIGQQQDQVRALADEHARAVDALGEHRHKITATDERRTELENQRRMRQSELEAAEAQHREAEQSLSGIRAGHAEAQAALAEMETLLENLARQSEQLEARQQTHSGATTEVKIELAKSEERLRNLQARRRQFEESQHERQRAISESREQLAQCRRRAGQSQWNVLDAETQIAELYLRKEAFARETVALIRQRDELGAGRTELTGGVQRIRSKIRKIEEKAHAQELAAGEIRHERNSLADRLREDYQIELAESEVEPTQEEQHRREEVQQEIDELRQKLGNLGNVNLEALAELEELDARYQNLSGQHKDLTDAKNELLRIIDRINGDSRRLFSETLETVRGHFQQLFRDLFGGGQADIVLEDDVDILESGIEIVARPPGKEPRSISLLSGGEKTMTCVALLLAIFRSRPSPFCVLDEVDAALDEANIDRFTKVLQDFLAWTQFIIVTHRR